MILLNLKRISKIAKAPLLCFNTSQNSIKDKALLKSIIACENLHSLENVVKQSIEHFNMYHITATLKKINLYQIRNEHPLVELIFSEIRSRFHQENFNHRENYNSIAIVIGLTGNLKYTALNDTLKKINFYELLSALGEKEFLLAFTGIMKLGLYDHYFSKDRIFEFLRISVANRNFNFGVLVSLWRHLIKFEKSSKELDNFFSSEILSLPNENAHFAKDTGYLMFCYNETHKNIDSQLKERFLPFVQDLSLEALSTGRMKVIDFCMFVNSLAKLSRIEPLAIMPELLNKISREYKRILQKYPVDLRFLDNAYIDLSILEYPNNNIPIYNLTALKFLHKIQNHEIEKDCEAFASLFFHMVEQYSRMKKKNKENEDNSLAESTERIQSIMKNVLDNTLYQPSFRFQNFTSLDVSKFCSALNSYSHSFPEFKLKDVEKDKIIHSFMSFNSFTKTSMHYSEQFLSSFQIKNPSLCRHLNNNSKGEYKITDGTCRIGLPQKECLKCLIE